MLEEAAAEVHWSYKVETDTFCARVTHVANNARCPPEEERVRTLFAALVSHQLVRCVRSGHSLSDKPRVLIFCRCIFALTLDSPELAEELFAGSHRQW